MFTNKTPWIVLLLLWMGGSTWWHVCKIKQLCSDDTPTTSLTANAAAMPGLTIADGAKLNLNVPGNFSYAKSGDVANAAAVGNTVQTVADYLKANPGRIMTVMGHYHADEQNPGSYPNLGIARAEAIKADLVDLGVPAAQIATASMLVSTPQGAMMPYSAKGDSLYGGLGFSFTGKAVDTTTVALDTTTTTLDTTTVATAAIKPKTEEALAEAQKFTSVFKPIDLYFKTGQSNYIKTEDTKKFFAEAEKYLKGNKDKKLMLTGHTDDMGPDGVNLALSKARASGVKSRLRKDGISMEQIVVEAKGETQPKESNATSEGRKANRRVTVVVQ
jgi:OmpA-OmpF porin, OOP family